MNGGDYAPRHKRHKRDAEAPHQPVPGRPDESEKRKLGMLRRRVTNDPHDAYQEWTERDRHDHCGQHSKGQEFAAVARYPLRSSLLSAAPIHSIPIEKLPTRVGMSCLASQRPPDSKAVEQYLGIGLRPEPASTRGRRLGLALQPLLPVERDGEFAAV